MSRKMYGYTALLATGLLAATLAGCGSDKKGSVETSTSGGVATVGDTACFQCHAATADPLTGETFVEQYARSLHAELGCESCHGGGAQHNGVGPLPFPKPDAARCASCHDGVTTYMGKVAPLSSSSNFQNGNHANPFGAEEAHEAKCARCHSHEGSILYGKDGFSGDATIINNTAYQPVLARDPETFNTIQCGTCHEHGGNIRQTKTRDANGNIVAWDPNGNGVTDQYDICTSCHTVNTNANNKNNKTYLIGSGNGASPVGYGFFTISTASNKFTNISTAPYYHNTRWFRTLPSTHVDQVATATTSGGTIIEGYVIRKSGNNAKNPCYDCHGHEFKANTRALADHPERGATTYTDWAQSAHAGKLLTNKIAASLGKSGKAQVDAVMRAGVTEVSGAAWSHYDWDSSSRTSCQRCHTSTGASNFMKNPSVMNQTTGAWISGYDPSQTFVSGNSERNDALNDFTHLSGWSRNSSTGAITSSGQNELLYCWGCHEKAGNGKLYTPGARLETYAAVNSTATGTTGTPVTVAYPDVSGSNVCMTCHLGREIGDTIKAITDADGVLGFVNSHYLAAGGQLFGKSGYTYTGRDYVAVPYFAHDKIGTAAAPGTGSNGPCVGCHMTSPNKHKFTNVSSSADGLKKTITSSLCATCHNGIYAFSDTSLVTEEEEYEAALAALDAVLQVKGIYFYKGANPYFFTAPYVVGGTNTSYTNWAGPFGIPAWKDVMGASFNLNLLAHDPGGYAHNRIYVKRLIWDSIDFMYDGTLNNDVTAAIDAQVTAGRLTAGLATDAKTYLGTVRP